MSEAAKITPSYLKPINTAYCGCLFRSRLEARWAVFFDAMGIKWAYETEGYQLDDGAFYLPDFYLPTHRYFIEIKAGEATADESKKCESLAAASGCKVYLFENGISPLPNSRLDSNDLPHALKFSAGMWDNYQMWGKCPYCGKTFISFNGWNYKSDQCECKRVDRRDKVGWADPAIIAAYRKALSARFEFGVVT